MIFEQPRWPLHTALAWVITRDRFLAEKAGPNDFWPYVPRDEHEELGEERAAWQLLFTDMKEGRVSVFGKRLGEDDTEEMKIPPEELEGLDWGMYGGQPALRKRAATQDEDEHLPADSNVVFTDVLVASGQMFGCYLPGSEPIAFSTKHIGAPEPPLGPDFMALSAAAYWIASKGGAFVFFARDQDVWKVAYKELLAQIVGGQVRVLGRRKKDTLPEPIEGFLFSGIEIDYPFPNDDEELSNSLMVGKLPYLQLRSLITTADWQIYNDSLRAGKTAVSDLRITHLQVSKSDIVRLWPFAADSKVAEETTLPRQSRLVKGKYPLIVKRLAELYPKENFPEGVPSPPEAPRKAMITQLLNSTAALGGKLDDETLKKAIELYNRTLGK
jgi:hypothetical protein